MAFIQIIELPRGGKVSTAEYFFRNGVAGQKCSILPGEIAEVPDAELEFHLETGFVMQVPSKDYVNPYKKKRGRPAKQAEVTDEFQKIYAARR